jgi:hypothetical protein
VDYGTAIEDSSVLPYTHVGRGLDVARSVRQPAGESVAQWRSRSGTRTSLAPPSPAGIGLDPGAKTEIASPITEMFEIEPVPHAALRPRTVLRILSKGEV